jgi:DNA mismatch endonuclease (patch repair protein)
MADIVSPAKRSQMMSGIRGKNTKPEITVRKFLHQKGLRFRLHAKLPGKPDLTFPKYKTAVFVHGCFWHRHEGCRFSTTPKNNADFWQKKFAANVERDARATAQLEELGWRVLIVWECQLGLPELEQLAATIRDGERGE